MAESEATIVRNLIKEYQSLAAASRAAGNQDTAIRDQLSSVAAQLQPYASTFTEAQSAVTDINQYVRLIDQKTSTPPVDTAPAAVATNDDGQTQYPSQRPTIVQIGDTESLRDTEFGTNPPVVKGVTSQSVSPDFGTQFGTTQGGPQDLPPWPGVAGEADGRATPGGDPGAFAQSDDSGTRQNTAKIINSAFNSKIVPQKSVLDQYASYTYSLSWYLMEPNIYKTFLSTKKKTLAGFQLLAQSGGAQVGASGNNLQQTPAGNTVGGSVNVGRNSFFSLDYYLDNLDLESLITGAGNRMAHNMVNMRFNVVEPTGVTLIENLAKAVSSVYKDAKIPYAVAQYCMVVRFYGYDENGNLISKGKNQNSVTDQNAIVEKYYPFLITNIKFRLSSRMVEYTIEAKPIPHTIGFGQDLGVIKQDITLTGTTLKDVLVGQAVNSPAPNNAALDGRQDTPQPADQFVQSVKVGDGVIDAQSASGTTSTEFTNTQQTNLVATNIPGVNTSF